MHASKYKTIIITKPFKCGIGLQQGSPLSSFLFNLFVNDLSKLLNFCDNSQKIQIGNCYINHLLYADDLVLVSDSVIGLQRLLNKLSLFCDNSGLLVNISKTKTLVFKRGGI